MNRRQFLATIGAAIAAPAIGVGVPGSSGLHILEAHDATAPVIGWIKGVVPGPCCLSFSSHNHYYWELMGAANKIDKTIGVMLTECSGTNHGGDLWFYELEFKPLPMHPEFYEEEDFNALVTGMILNEV